MIHGTLDRLGVTIRWKTQMEILRVKFRNSSSFGRITRLSLRSLTSEMRSYAMDHASLLAALTPLTFHGALGQPRARAQPSPSEPVPAPSPFPNPSESSRPLLGILLPTHSSSQPHLSCSSPMPAPALSPCRVVLLFLVY